MKTLLISSTEESTGKTAIALALGLLGTDRGLSVGYMKPKGTRLQSHVGKTLDADPMLAREILDLEDEMHELEPVVYSPTFIEQAIAGRERPEELREEIARSFEKISDGRDLMVVEGGGEDTAGAVVGLTDADLAEVVDAEVVLVTRYEHPSDIDDVLAAAARLGDRLAGVVFNSVAATDFDQVETAVVPFLEARDIPVLGVLPRKRDLAGVTVADLAAELNAEQLTDAPTDAYIERFVVGAMGGDSALRYFRRTKDAAVITGGDRTDIHTVALEAPGVKCLVLTGGFRPPGAVIGKAEERGVPVLLVQSDTLTVIDGAEELIRSGRVQDAETVDAMRDLLFEHADVDALLGTSEEA